MKYSISIFKVFVLFVFIHFIGCKKDDTSTTVEQFPSFILKSDTVFAAYDTIVKLKGFSANGYTGVWSIVTDNSSTGKLEDPNKANSSFIGKLQNTYILKYKLTKGSESKEQLVTIKFEIKSTLVDTVLEVINSTDTSDLSVKLNALPLHSSLKGNWSIVSTNGSPSLSNLSDPNSIITGEMGEEYKLKWTVSAKDNSITPVENFVTVKFNRFTDKRDNEKYLVVKMGSQLWMGENLRYKEPNSIYFDITSYNNSDYMRKKYGMLYTYPEAIRSIPAGWALPDSTDWLNLLAYVRVTTGDSVSAIHLKSTTGWVDDTVFWYNDTIRLSQVSFILIPRYRFAYGNGFGFKNFNVVPSGYIQPNLNLALRTFVGVGREAIFWSNSYVGNKVYCVNFSYSNKAVNKGYWDKNTGYSLSIRCIKK